MSSRTLHVKTCDFCATEFGFENGLPSVVAGWGEFTHYDDSRDDSRGNLSRHMDTCPVCTRAVLRLRTCQEA